MIRTTMQRVPLSINPLVERAGRLFPQVEIVSRLPDKSLRRHRFADYHRRTRQLGAALLAAGLKKGDRVATLCWNHHAHLECYFGIPAAGGVMHTLNLRLAPDEIGWIAGDALNGTVTARYLFGAPMGGKPVTWRYSKSAHYGPPDAITERFGSDRWLFVGSIDDRRDREDLRREEAALGAGAIGGVAVILVPVLLTALVAEQSNRPAIDLVGAGRGSLHPAQLLTLYAADIFQSAGQMAHYWGPPSLTWRTTGLYTAQNVGVLYVGAVTALAMITGLVTRTLWNAEIRFVTVAGVALIAYALGWYSPLFPAMPTVSG